MYGPVIRGGYVRRSWCMKKKEFPNPWQRYAPNPSYTPEELDDILKYSEKWPRFTTFFENNMLDVYTKSAALKASPSVVSVVSYSGEEELFRCSGIVIESDTILTSAALICSPMDNPVIAENIKVDLEGLGIPCEFQHHDRWATIQSSGFAAKILEQDVVVYLSNGRSLNGEVVVHDFHYNLAIVKVKLDTPLPTVVLRRIDDSCSVALVKESSFQLRTHSDSFNLIPGKKVIALGRYFTKPYDLMAASGEFSLGRCEYECKELFTVNCRITKCGIGGPLINHDAEVIGITFYDRNCTPFLPINVVIKWWELYKKYRVCRRPWLQMEVINLYTVQLDILEKVVKEFPSIFKGVLVEQVEARSSTDVPGICINDVIVQCSGQNVLSFLELFEIIWDKVGEPVELVVARLGHDGPLHLSMLVVDAEPDQFYNWSRAKKWR